MNRIVCVIAIVFSCYTLWAQDFRIGFSATGESQIIDSVKVQNLSSGTVFSIAGDDILQLVPLSGSRWFAQTGSTLLIYPNPAESSCVIEFFAQNSGPVVIELSDVSGKTVLRQGVQLTQAVHVFSLTGISGGVYNLSVMAETFMYSGKLVGLGSPGQGMSIEKIGSYEAPQFVEEVISTKSTRDLAYNYGDILLFEAFSDMGHRTIKTLRLFASDQSTPERQLDFVFVDCLDAEGFMYATLAMGEHIWMAENLNTSFYANLQIIPQVSSVEEWVALQSGAFCNYDNDGSMGRLYNWYAVVDSRKICPLGWHSPADFEWQRLEMSLGMSEAQTDTDDWRGQGYGNMLKEAGTENWISHTGNDINASGFGAVPNGIRNFAGEFYYDGKNATWWTSTGFSDLNAWSRGLQYDKTEIFRQHGRKKMGMSVRCIMNYPPELVTDSVSDITQNTASSGGRITNNGGAEITEKGLVWSTTPNPSIVHNSGFTSNASTENSFSDEITELEPETTYYLRAYAANSAGYGYGNEIEFITSEDTIPSLLPEVTTSAVIDVTAFSAMSGGNVSSQGAAPVSARGVVWATHNNPSLSDNDGITNDGSGLGVFESSVEGLTPLTTYYLRAYAENEHGVAYGDTLSFTTLEDFGIVTDGDGNTYSQVSIGTQRWLGANLATTKYSNSDPIDMVNLLNEWETLTGPAYCWYANDFVTYGSIYGALYNWYAVDYISNGGRNICPEGWHVPTNNEWAVLANYAGGFELAGGKLKEVGTVNWSSPNLGASDEFGFTALPGGGRGISDPDFTEINQVGFWWSSTAADAFQAWNVDAASNTEAMSNDPNTKNDGMSVRCLKNNAGSQVPTVETVTVNNITTSSAIAQGEVISENGYAVLHKGFVYSSNLLEEPTLANNEGFVLVVEGSTVYSTNIISLLPLTDYNIRAFAVNSVGVGYGETVSFQTLEDLGTVTDADGNEYEQIVIGNQRWLSENLKTTQYSDNTPISQITDNLGWTELTTPAYCWYENDQLSYGDVYGALYNWYSVDYLSNGGKNICPEGWHIPDETDWTTLIDFLGGELVAGAKMKEVGTVHWTTNSDGTNESGFTALPAGNRYDDGLFYYIGQTAVWWSLTEYLAEAAYTRQLYGHESNAWQGGLQKNNGLSLRCVKNNAGASVPVVTTKVVNSVMPDMAYSGGNIISDGGYEVIHSGVIWSSSAGVVLNNAEGMSLAGAGTSTFTSQANSLLPSTQYFVKAFAINSLGVGYGNELSFTTTEFGLPVADVDGNVYTTLRVGTDFWTTHNLKTTRYNDNTDIPVNTGDWNTKGVIAMTWFDNDEATYGDTYGALYSWGAIDTATNGGKNICPAGYHVANNDDWMALIEEWGGMEEAGDALKEAGFDRWNQNNTGTNISGFTALPGGQRSPDNSFNYLGGSVWWWSADSDGESNLNAWSVMIGSAGGMVYHDLADVNYGFSVRCVKNQIPINTPTIEGTSISNIDFDGFTVTASITNNGGALVSSRGVVWNTTGSPDIDNNEGLVNQGSGNGEFVCEISGLTPVTTYYVRAFATNESGTSYDNEVAVTTDFLNCGTITDADLNEYQTVSIGSQCWMRENLAVTQYSDNTPIPEIGDAGLWANSNSPAMCWYENDYVSYGSVYGALYKYYAVDYIENGNRNICPDGWHIPGDEEWTELIDALGGMALAGGKMKEAGTVHWLDPNTGATNESGFTALPGGSRDFDGVFGYITEQSNWWIPVEFSPEMGWRVQLTNLGEDVYIGESEKSNGASLRCVKNTVGNTIAILSTTVVNNITPYTADIDYEITANGGYHVTRCGVLWSTNPDPDISTAIDITNDGSGTGVFNAALTELEPQTTYYVRAYAVNVLGIAYGNVLEFVTADDPNAYDGDGNVYVPVVIGDQTWLSTNLTTTSFNDASPIANYEMSYDWDYSPDAAYCWFNNLYDPYGIDYGALYNFNACDYIITKGKNICPSGYHVATAVDLLVLYNYLTDNGFAGNEAQALKATTLWMAGGEGTDDLGFAALPGGMRDLEDSFFDMTTAGYWWTQLEHNSDSARAFYITESDLFNDFDIEKYRGFSVRCVKNSEASSVPVLTTTEATDITWKVALSGGNVTDEGGYPVTKRGIVWSTTENPTMESGNMYLNEDAGLGEFVSNITGLQAETIYYVRAFAVNATGVGYGNQISFVTTEDMGIYDGDGNEYTAVTIGTQVWLKENLMTTSYNDNAPLSNFEDDLDWESFDGPAYCWYENNYETYGSVFGALYNGYVFDFTKTWGKNLCPVGYHLATENDWMTLVMFAGGTYNAASKLKSTGLWMEYPGTDGYGFRALPAGGRMVFGGGQGTKPVESFSNVYQATMFWMNMVNEEDMTFILGIDDFSSEIVGGEAPKTAGASLRCMKNPEASSVPVVEIESVFNISYESAICTGNLISEGGYPLQYTGVVWSTSPEPSVEANMGSYMAHASMQEFSFPVDLLADQTTYYVRFFAVNAIGVGYSEDYSFTTTEFLGIFDGDGNEYSFVSIGAQKWLTENLKTTSYNDASPIANVPDPFEWETLLTPAYCWYENDFVTYGTSYGALYNYYATNPAKNGGKNLCPEGWHVPDEWDWIILSNEVGGDWNAGMKLKSTTLWQSGGEGTDDYGFSALPAGIRLSSDGYSDITTETYFWTSTALMNDFVTTRNMSAFSEYLNNYSNTVRDGLSVRCVKNHVMALPPSISIQTPTNVTFESASLSGTVESDLYQIIEKGVIISTTPDVNISNAENIFVKGSESGAFVAFIGGLQELTTYYIRAYAANTIGIAYSDELSFTTPANMGIIDGAGNVYNSVVIGSQEWLSTNLRTNKYSDGSAMTKIVDDQQWQMYINPAYCWYNNDSISNWDVYGAMYNFYSTDMVLTGGRNICPAGYHVPDYAEWDELINYIGGSTIAGGALKETGLAHWQIPNNGAFDGYSFTALPGGQRQAGSFMNLGYTGDWWFSSEYDDWSGYALNLQNATEDALYNFYDKNMGASIRCIKNQEFSTIPAVSTTMVQTNEFTSIYAEGYVNETGGTNIINKGFIYGTTPNVNFDNMTGFVKYGPFDGWFGSDIQGLYPGTTYYIRAFAYNAQGMALGNVLSATTQSIPMPIDGDGNTYGFVVIGNQIWLAENLKTTKYNDGTPIPLVTDNIAWQGLMTPGYTYYNNDYVSFGEEYGVLYNWFALSPMYNGDKNPCPVGWIVSDDMAWQNLMWNLGGEMTAATKLKEAGPLHWGVFNTANNETGFSALPGGIRNTDGSFEYVNTAGLWWTTSAWGEPFQAYSVRMEDDSEEVFFYELHQNSGMSVRCVYDPFGMGGEIPKLQQEE